MTFASEMRCEGPAVCPGVPVARRRLVMAGRRKASVTGAPPSAWALTRWNLLRELSDDHRGRCGASLKHRARDALGLADLRPALPIARTRAQGEAQGLRQASMSRGVEARGSFWTPGVPRALGWGPAAKDQEDGPARGLDKEHGRWCLRGEMLRKAVSGIRQSQV